MKLELILNEMYRTGSKIYECLNGKEYSVEVAGRKIEFFGPTGNTIQVMNQSSSTEMYYLVVAGLMYDVLDVLVESIQIGSLVIPRSKVWKVYDKFLQEIDVIDSRNVTAASSELFESRFISENSSWEALTDFLENSNSVDQYDIAEFLTPTFKQRLEAELRQLRLIKGLKPTQSLF